MDRELKVTKLDDIQELAGFSCGISEIDGIIENFLPKTIAENLSDVYVVRYIDSDIVCAVFALSKTYVRLDSYDINELNDDYSDIEPENVKYENYPAIEIDLLAVKESERNCHIGKEIIQKLNDNYINFGFKDCLFIIVDAYFKMGYTAVPFYENCGFRMTGQIATIDTMRLFRPIL